MESNQTAKNITNIHENNIFQKYQASNIIQQQNNYIEQSKQYNQNDYQNIYQISQTFSQDILSPTANKTNQTDKNFFKDSILMDSFNYRLIDQRERSQTQYQKNNKIRVYNNLPPNFEYQNKQKLIKNETKGKNQQKKEQQNNHLIKQHNQERKNSIKKQNFQESVKAFNMHLKRIKRCQKSSSHKKKNNQKYQKIGLKNKQYLNKRLNDQFQQFQIRRNPEESQETNYKQHRNGYKQQIIQLPPKTSHRELIQVSVIQQVKKNSFLVKFPNIPQRIMKFSQVLSIKTMGKKVLQIYFQGVGCFWTGFNNNQDKDTFLKCYKEHLEERIN